MEGTCDRYLEIDLSSKTFKKGKIEQDRLRKFIGGKGVGLSLLVEQDTSKDPLDPENPLIFVTGPLTGSLIQTSARSAVVTRSPLTGCFLDSHAGGHFGPAMRRAGWDYVSIRGASDKPVYIVLSPEGVQFHDATDLWGKDAFETETILHKKHERSKMACIGQAGENLVRYAAICTELYRHYGRGGSGAVMGSKNLKAVVATGMEKIEHQDEEEFKSLATALTADLKEHQGAKYRHEKGTMMWVRMGHEMGGFLPTKNWQRGRFDKYEQISSETMRKELSWKDKGCYGCTVIKCSKVAQWDGKEMEGPEYETTAYLGSNCLLENAKDVATANWLCDKYGLDTISTGGCISFAMECAEKGILSEEDNKRISFGSAESSHALIEDIALRRGIGNVLAEGTRRASKIIGKGSDYFAIQTAGMELSGVNPLGCYSMGLGLATSDFASHTRMWSATDEMNGNLALEDVSRYVVGTQNSSNVRNSLIACDFLPYDCDRILPFLNASTGFDYTEEESKLIGARIQSLSRLYSLRCGRTHEDDVLPPRFYEEESVSGLMKGKRIPRELFEQQVQEVFAIRGWDEEGRPTDETCQRLGI